MHIHVAEASVQMCAFSDTMIKGLSNLHCHHSHHCHQSFISHRQSSQSTSVWLRPPDQYASSSSSSSVVVHHFPPYGFGLRTNMLHHHHLFPLPIPLHPLHPSSYSIPFDHLGSSISGRGLSLIAFAESGTGLFHNPEIP